MFNHRKRLVLTTSISIKHIHMHSKLNQSLIHHTPQDLELRISVFFILFSLFCLKKKYHDSPPSAINAIYQARQLQRFSLALELINEHLLVETIVLVAFLLFLNKIFRFTRPTAPRPLATVASYLQPSSYGEKEQREKKTAGTKKEPQKRNI